MVNHVAIVTETDTESLSKDLRTGKVNLDELAHDIFVVASLLHNVSPMGLF
jgi:hypothetical protein